MAWKALLCLLVSLTAASVSSLECYNCGDPAKTEECRESTVQTCAADQNACLDVFSIKNDKRKTFAKLCWTVDLDDGFPEGLSPACQAQPHLCQMQPCYENKCNSEGINSAARPASVNLLAFVVAVSAILWEKAI